MWSRISYPNDRSKVRVQRSKQAARGAALRIICGVWFIGIAAAACAGGEDSAPAPNDTSSAATTDRGVAGPDPSCPKVGAWQPCNVLDRLESAGLVVTRQPDPARFPFFSVEGTTYSTSRSSIHVFLYRDQAARRRDTDQLDSVAVAPRNGSYAWSDPAVLVTSNNLAAVVVSPNERQSERIILALSAGLPPGKR